MFPPLMFGALVADASIMQGGTDRCPDGKDMTMDRYYRIRLSKKVPTRSNAKGSDFAVCRAPSEREAVAQLLPEMRAHVILVVGYDEIWRCYE